MFSPYPSIISVSGWTYKPTNQGSYFVDTSLTNSSLSTFNGQSPNGDWKLYGGDDYNGSFAGSIAGGWSLNFTIAQGITSFSPTEGAVGDNVGISGTGLDGATAVKFGSTPASSFTVDSPTHITARVPPGASTGPIAVAGGSGTSTSATDFVDLDDDEPTGLVEG